MHFHIINLPLVVRWASTVITSVQQCNTFFVRWKGWQNGHGQWHQINASPLMVRNKVTTLMVCNDFEMCIPALEQVTVRHLVKCTHRLTTWSSTFQGFSDLYRWSSCFDAKSYFFFFFCKVYKVSNFHEQHVDECYPSVLRQVTFFTGQTTLFMCLLEMCNVPILDTSLFSSQYSIANVKDLFLTKELSNDFSFLLDAKRKWATKFKWSL